jgi:hypothetical protein
MIRAATGSGKKTFDNVIPAKAGNQGYKEQENNRYGWRILPLYKG